MNRADLVEVVLRGGYPIAVGLPARARARWFANLVTLVVERLGDDVGRVRRGDQVSRFLRLAAARTGQVLNIAEIGREAVLGRDQAGAYLRLLELDYLVVQVPDPRWTPHPLAGCSTCATGSATGLWPVWC